MADNAPVMIWVSGGDKLCTWFNKPWLEFTGRTLKQESGIGWTKGVHPDDLVRCIDTYVASFDARLPFTMEYRLRRRDGEWRWVLDNGIPLYEGDIFKGYIGSCIDVTGRKQVEDVLREREGLLRAILNTVGDAIITIDRRGIMIAANPAAERMFGYAYDELIGNTVKMLIPQSERDKHNASISRYLEMIGSEREVVSLRKDGSTFPTELTVSKIEHLGLFTGIYRDIRARKRAEREVEQYRKDLRTMSSELMLAEERERQRLAQDLHDGLGQALFRARMKLDQLSMDDPAVGEITTILEDVSKMLNTMTFELSPPVLRQLGLRSAIKWLARDITERYGVSVRIDDDGQEIPLAERVALLLFRSVRELLINVAKHAQANLAILSLRKTNNLLKVEVEDQGRGFDPATQSSMVESGHFGLFSIRERLEYVGGTFQIRSMQGGGTKITLVVPLSVGKATVASGR